MGFFFLLGFESYGTIKCSFSNTKYLYKFDTNSTWNLKLLPNVIIKDYRLKIASPFTHSNVMILMQRKL